MQRSAHKDEAATNDTTLQRTQDLRVSEPTDAEAKATLDKVSETEWSLLVPHVPVPRVSTEFLPTGFSEIDRAKNAAQDTGRRNFGKRQCEKVTP